MPYLGNPVVDRFTSTKAASVYSGDGSTVAFTLEHSVGSDEDILVSVDGVIQEPSVAYAVSSGTTLTFTAAPSNNAGNNIFVYYLFRTIGTVTHPPTSALSATSGTFSGAITGGGLLTTGGNIVIPDAGNIGSASDTDAIAISSGGVVTLAVPPIITTPIIFQGYSTTTYSADGVWVADVETIDTTNSHNSSTGLFTCPRAGYYKLGWHALYRGAGNIRTNFRKNGTKYGTASGSSGSLLYNDANAGDEENIKMTLIMECAATDTIDVHLDFDGGDIYGNDNVHNGLNIHFLG